MQIHTYLENLACLTLNQRALLSTQCDAQLEEQLGNALQESLHQSEHAQISSQAKQEVVLMFERFPWMFGSPPEQPETLLQQVIIPVDIMKSIHFCEPSQQSHVKGWEHMLTRSQGRNIHSHTLSWGTFRVPNHPRKPTQETSERADDDASLRTYCWDVSQS